MVSSIAISQRLFTRTNFNNTELGKKIHQDNSCLRLVTTLAITALAGFVGYLVTYSFLASAIFSVAASIINSVDLSEKPKSIEKTEEDNDLSSSASRDSSPLTSSRGSDSSKRVSNASEIYKTQIEPVLKKIREFMCQWKGDEIDISECEKAYETLESLTDLEESLRSDSLKDLARTITTYKRINGKMFSVIFVKEWLDSCLKVQNVSKEICDEYIKSLDKCLLLYPNDPTFASVKKSLEHVRQNSPYLS